MLARDGMGDRLYTAAANMSDAMFQRFLVGWRRSVKAELETNASRLLDRKYAALSTRITESWPNVNVIKMFVKPVISIELGLLLPAATRRAAQLGELARLCKRHFSFGSPIGVLKVFERQIWHGLALDALMQQTLGTISAKKLKKIAHILSTLPLINHGGVEYLMEVDLTYAIKSVLNGLAGTRALVEAAQVTKHVEQMDKVKHIRLSSKFSWAVGSALMQEYMSPTANDI